MLAGHNRFQLIHWKYTHTKEKELRILTHSALKTERTLTWVWSNRRSFTFCSPAPIGSIACANPSSPHAECYLPLFILNSVSGIPSGGWTHTDEEHVSWDLIPAFLMHHTQIRLLHTLVGTRWLQTSSQLQGQFSGRKGMCNSRHFFLRFEANHTVDIHTRTHTHRQTPAHMGIIPVCYETTCILFTKIWSRTMY